MLLCKHITSHSSVGKESACNTGDCSSIPRSGRSTGEGIGYPLQYSWASLVAQLVKNLPAMRETWVWSLGWEDPLEKGKATHSIFWPGEFHGHSPWGRKSLKFLFIQSSEEKCLFLKTVKVSQIICFLVDFLVLVYFSCLFQLSEQTELRWMRKSL